MGKYVWNKSQQIHKFAHSKVHKLSKTWMNQCQKQFITVNNFAKILFLGFYASHIIESTKLNEFWILMDSWNYFPLGIQYKLTGHNAVV